jgi:hypothetical protein
MRAAVLPAAACATASSSSFDDWDQAVRLTLPASVPVVDSTTGAAAHVYPHSPVQ